MPTPVVERSRSHRLAGPALVGAAGAATVALLHVRDPHEPGSYGFCPFLELTGRPCAGCGGLRAVNLLTHGDVAGAVSSNVLVLALGALLAATWVVWVLRRWRDEPTRAVSDRTLLVLLVVVLAFGVVRNTPWGAGLAP